MHERSSFESEDYFLSKSDDINGHVATGPFFQESTNYSFRFISLAYSYSLIESEKVSFSLGAGISQVNGLESSHSLRGERSGDDVIIGYFENTESGQSINVMAKLLRRVNDHIRVGLRSEIDVFSLNPGLQAYFETRF